MSIIAAAGAAMNSGDVLNKIANFTDSVANAATHAQSGSLVRMTSTARVEPLVIVDSDCVNLEYISEVMQTLQSIFSGYYLQAVSLMSRVGDVQVISQLDPLNPNRDPDLAKFLRNLDAHMAKESFTQNSWKLSAENYKWRLPTTANKRAVALEAEDSKSAISDKAISSVQELSNLSVGKLINVKIQSNDQTLTVPIAIRLIVNELRPNTIVQMFGKGEVEKSFIERYYKWKAGRISFFNDLIFCKDLIREHKKDLMNDKDGVFSEISHRANKNKIAGLMAKRPSMATASNMYIISEATASAIKRTSGVDLSSFSQRQKLFEETYAMILVIIDRDYQRVSFYHDGIKLPTTVGVRDLRNANKNSGPNIMDILSAYKQGAAPTL